MRAVLIVISVLMLSGCGTNTTLNLNSAFVRGDLPKVSAFAAANGVHSLDLNSAVASNPALAPGASQSVGDEYADVLSHCQVVLSGYEGDAQGLKWASFGVAMIGTIAGSIVVPALSAATNIDKTAVAAVGGLSGAANSAQNALNSGGLTAAEVLATRNAIQQQLSAALTAYYAARKTGDLNGQLAALDQARGACVNYAIQTGNATNSSGS